MTSFLLWKARKHKKHAILRHIMNVYFTFYILLILLLFICNNCRFKSTHNDTTIYKYNSMVCALLHTPTEYVLLVSVIEEARSTQAQRKHAYDGWIKYFLTQQ